MRILLLLDETASRFVCSEYFTARGCEVDVAADLSHAEALLRFRGYDAVVGDLPRDEETREGTLRVLESARRRHPAMPAVVLTTSTADLPAISESLTVLTKPQRLEAILDVAVAGGRG